MKTHIIIRKGEVLESLRDAKFKVRLDDGQELRAYSSGKMRLNHIKILVGDNVTLELRDDMNIKNQVCRITRRN